MIASGRHVGHVCDRSAGEGRSIRRRSG